MQHEIEKTTARNSRAACNPMQHEITKTVPSSKRPGVVAAGITFCRRPDRLFAKRTQFPAAARSHKMASEPLTKLSNFNQIHWVTSPIWTIGFVRQISCFTPRTRDPCTKTPNDAQSDSPHFRRSKPPTSPMAQPGFEIGRAHV